MINLNFFDQILEVWNAITAKTKLISHGSIPLCYYVLAQFFCKDIISIFSVWQLVRAKNQKYLSWVFFLQQICDRQTFQITFLFSVKATNKTKSWINKRCYSDYTPWYWILASKSRAKEGVGFSTAPFSLRGTPSPELPYVWIPLFPSVPQMLTLYLPRWLVSWAWPDVLQLWTWFLMAPNPDPETSGGICRRTVNAWTWGGVKTSVEANEETQTGIGRLGDWFRPPRLPFGEQVQWDNPALPPAFMHPHSPTSLPRVSTLPRACVHGEMWYRG